MADNQALEIAWYGQAMFTVSGGGITVACDPVPPEVGYTYGPVDADAVLISHEHFDHGYLAGIKGSPTVIKKTGGSRLDGIEVTGIATFHDAKGGKERGPDIIFTWEQAGFRIAHFGDLGVLPGAEMLSSLSGLDVVMLPVGGVFTIDGGQAARLAKDLAPAIAIPMHYKTPACSIPIKGAGEFTGGFSGPVREVAERPVVITRDTLPSATEVWVLPYQ
ncbi:MAG: MBL fold metallo-hydrolase [Actinobacteria bacterium]|nr:MBL fold metallo-hydrolase [Actinomycetota bacterium]